ncbi:unknown [Clostridium sp. CAG:1000]|jgi:hypothetical protein|nr:hypothetical protein [Clostridium sp.]CCX35549.1 unknown [Clostridium sp. CAG:1000]
MKKYIIDKDNPNEKLLYYNVDVVGLSVTPNKSVPGYKITAKKLTLVDPDLREAYIKQKINKKIDRVIKFMIKILNDEDTSDEDAGIVLDEINKLKGIIINKYKEYMIESEYKSLLTKLILIEEEFKKNYNQKTYLNYMTNSVYEEAIQGRGR